jgi:RNA polymerase sigma-70 factor, ECF subfamily
VNRVPSKAGETDKFHRLIWPHRSAVLRTARFLERDEGAAEDLAQETLLKAFRSIDRFDEASNACAWLLRILRNARIDRLRSEATRRAHEQLDSTALEVAEARRAAKPVSTPEDWADAGRMLEQFSDGEVIEALRRLPDDIRWTLLLVDVEGLDQQDAASVLDVPVGTVKSRVHRGRTMLRDVLTPRARELRLIS